MTRRKAFFTTIAVLLAALLAFAFHLSRQRLRRHRVFRPAGAPSKAPATIPPVAQWTSTFQSLGPADLDDLLNRIESAHPDLYASHSLAYLHARSRLEDNDLEGAETKLRPFLAAGHPFRDLALYHLSEIEDGRDHPDDASRFRQSLIFEHASSIYRDQAIDEEVARLSEQKDVAALAKLAGRLHPAASTRRRRELEAILAETQLLAGDGAGADQRALALLRGGTNDDASDRAARVLDRSGAGSGRTLPQVILIGETMRNHRHYDRAVALLSLALNRTAPATATKTLPIQQSLVAAPRKKTGPVGAKKTAARPSKGKSAKNAAKPAPPPAPTDRDALLFSIGRCYYGEEKYAEAQQTYLRGAAETKSPEQQATFLLHASRAAQLRGDDRTAEQLMTRSIAVPGRFPATTAALTQRLRTRLAQRRDEEAAADLNQIRRLAPDQRAVLEASLAYAIGMIAHGEPAAALRTLNAVPASLLKDYDRPEFNYWRARAQEESNPQAAFAAYLSVLRADVPTHFAYLARARLAAPAMSAKLSAELLTREREIERQLAAKNLTVARGLATDQLLLSTRDRTRLLRRLTEIYRQSEAHRTILELQPEPFPSVPDRHEQRVEILLSLGLFDEAIDEIPQKWPLRPLRSALTQSLALNRGGASQPSIYAIEVLMKSVPEGYVPDLLPLTIRQLLYPRYFLQEIESDAEKYGADPTLVLSIMREESRFNPRAKSAAAARGLLQFIISTARNIGREIGLVDLGPEDLYDPRVIISLGAKYVATLGASLGNDPYRIAAAYNAGPKQSALWSRLAPAPGADFFLSSINFDETRHYVRKVMNSHRRYSEIYGGGGPQGGLRPEP